MLTAFSAFIDALQRENRAELLVKQRKLRERTEQERKHKEGADAQRRRDREAETPILISDHPWQCDVCTFLNASSLRAVCDMCGAANPLASAADPHSQAGAGHPQQTPRGVLNEGLEKEETEQRVARTSADDFFYHALRSRALKALCHLLQHGPTSVFLAHSQLLPNLLSLATRPTQMDGFMSIGGLEQREERLLELLLDKSGGIINDQQRFADRAKGCVLAHSPFKSLTVLLPSCIDLGSSRSIAFVTDDCCTVRLSRQRASSDGHKDVSVTVIRSNHLVPNSLPAYYFEVSVLDMGAAKSDASSFNLAIGLFRSGMALKGYPGSNNSYAYASRGEAMATSGGRVVRTPYGPSFATGDVVGCWWNLRKNTITFTHNGRIIDGHGGAVSPGAAGGVSGGKTEMVPAFTSVNGRFYPAAWLESDQQSLRVNWGQEPFRFDFFSTLPPGYLHSISTDSAADVGRVPRTAAEIKRRTQAEELSLICSFPVELCEIALEQKADDMERAVFFLLESGQAELDRMAQEVMQQSKMMEEERKARVLGVGDGGADDRDDHPSDDEEDLADWLTSGQSSHCISPGTARRRRCQRSGVGRGMGRRTRPRPWSAGQCSGCRRRQPSCSLVLVARLHAGRRDRAGHPRRRGAACQPPPAGSAAPADES